MRTTIDKAGRVVIPTADRKRLPSIDIAEFIEEERNRWPR